MLVITKERMFMPLSYFLTTSKLMQSKIEICFITQKIQIYQYNFSYFIDFYLFDNISVFIMLLVHILSFSYYINGLVTTNINRSKYLVAETYSL